MQINEIIYQASGMAARSPDIVTLDIYFYKNGQLVDSAQISGYSTDISGAVIPMMPIDADSMAVEALDLDFDQHSLIINGKEYLVPKTGSKALFFESQDFENPELIEIPELSEIIPYIEKPLEETPIYAAYYQQGIDQELFIAQGKLQAQGATIQTLDLPPASEAAAESPLKIAGFGGNIGGVVIAVGIIGALIAFSRRKKVKA